MIHHVIQYEGEIGREDLFFYIDLPFRIKPGDNLSLGLLEDANGPFEAEDINEKDYYLNGYSQFSVDKILIFPRNNIRVRISGLK